MKIFCIGFNKTGTTSLASFLSKNGFSVAPQTPFELELSSYINGDYEKILNKIKKDYFNYDFFQDIPFSLPFFYEKLYTEFPDSKFILLVRDNEKTWYNSFLNFHKNLFGDVSSPDKIIYNGEGWINELLTKVYKSPSSNPYDYESLTRVYSEHVSNSKKFFKDKKQNFLVLNITDKNLVQKLETFLKIKFKVREFPHLNKSRTKKAIFGYGGHAREVASYIEEDVTFFVQDEFVEKGCQPISKFNPYTHEMLIAVSDSTLRKKISESLPRDTQFFSFIHPTSIISGKVTLGKGCFVGPNCILTTEISLGNHCLLNRGNQIGHDCVIGDFVSLMPGSIISGNNTIGDEVYFGANSTTREKIKICNNVKIGLNSGVIKDISEPGIYVGTPTKLIKKK